MISNIVMHLFCPHYFSLLFPIMDIEDACVIIKPLPLFQGWSQPVSVLKQKKMYERKVCLIKLRVVFLGHD